MLKRDWIDYFIFIVIAAVVAAFVFFNYASAKKQEVREIEIDGYQLKIPPGFRMLTKSEKKNYGFAERIAVLEKGDMGHLIMIDIEKGLPTIVRPDDVEEYFKLTEEELRKNVDEIRFEQAKLDRERFRFFFVYTGKVKESSFRAAYLSKVDRGKKINITISVPEEQKDLLDDYLKTVSESIN
jgi:hypothetical protein